MIEAPEVSAAVRQALGERALDVREEHGWAIAVVEAERWSECAGALRDALGLDYLASLTAVDLKDNFELVAHLYSIAGRGKLALKCRLGRDNAVVESLTKLWSAADWLEREAAEMFGIHFEGHPNLAGLLLPDDWVGHPLRKDYDEADQD